MSRDREITVSDLQGDEQEASPIEEIAEDADADIRIGVGDCWIDDQRPCSAACMSFNTSHEEGTGHPCLLITAVQRIADPLIGQQDSLLSLLEDLRNATLTQNSYLDQLLQLLSTPRM